MSFARSLALFAGLVLASAAVAIDEAVAWIADQPVSRETWTEALRAQASAGPGSMEQAVAAARAALLRERAIWTLAAEAGLDSVRHDAELRDRHLADNESRRRRLAEGQPVYGPRQLAWPAFRRHWNASLWHALVRAELQQATPSPAELQKYYDTNATLFTDAQGALLDFKEYQIHVARQFVEARLERRIAAWIDDVPSRWLPIDTEHPASFDRTE